MTIVTSSKSVGTAHRQQPRKRPLYPSSIDRTEACGRPPLPRKCFTPTTSSGLTHRAPRRRNAGIAGSGEVSRSSRSLSASRCGPLSARKARPRNQPYGRGRQNVASFLIFDEDMKAALSIAAVILSGIHIGSADAQEPLDISPPAARAYVETTPATGAGASPKIPPIPRPRPANGGSVFAPPTSSVADVPTRVPPISNPSGATAETAPTPTSPLMVTSTRVDVDPGASHGALAVPPDHPETTSRSTDMAAVLNGEVAPLLVDPDPLAKGAIEITCNARTRAGTACRCKALKNGRCKLHGGMSTGPRTLAGRRRIAEVQRGRWQRSKRA